jgi:hypothetical protein
MFSFNSMPERLPSSPLSVSKRRRDGGGPGGRGGVSFAVGLSNVAAVATVAGGGGGGGKGGVKQSCGGGV